LTTKNSPPSWDQVRTAQRPPLLGPCALTGSATECTAKAITHRITKLREIAKTFDTAALATQSPVKRVRTPKAKAAQRNGDDDDGDESPTKKQKTTTIPKKTAKKGKPEREVKEEGEGEKSVVKAEESANDG
jgi:hypothetical protein